MEELKYYMFHKPRGCITAVTDPTHKTVMEYFADEKVEGLHPVGRLDKDTEGLLLITNDGKWNQEIMHPENHVPKTYFFWALGELDEEKIHRIENGVELRGMTAKPAKIKRCETKTLGDILDLAVNLGLVSKSGSWFAYNGDKIGQGRENAKNYLTENPAIMEELDAKIRKHYAFEGAEASEEEEE